MPLSPWSSLRRALPSIPLRWALTVPFLLTTTGAVGLVGYWSYRSGQEAVQKLGQNLVVQTNAQVAQELNAYLQTPLLVNRLNVDAVQQGQIDLQNTSRLESALFHRVLQFNQIPTVLFVSPEGRFRFVERFPTLYLGAANPDQPDDIQIYSLDGQGNRGPKVHEVKGLDVRRDRAFYQRAVTTGKLGWNPIDRYGNSDALTLTASQPVYDLQTKRLLGVFGVHLRLDYLTNFLRGLEISRAGQVIITDATGTMIATSTQERPFRTGDKIKQPNQFQQIRIDQSQNELTRALGEYLRSQAPQRFNQSQSLEFRYNGAVQEVQVTPYQDAYGLNWRIITLIPRSHFLAEIEANTRTTILLCLLTLGVALLLGSLAGSQLNHRFSQLNQASRALAEGDLDQRLPTDTPIAEFNSLSQTFNQMAEQLQQSFDRIQTALEASEAKFTTIFRTSPDPIAIADLAEGRLLEVNDSLLAFFGLSRAELVGRTTLELNLWHDLEQQNFYRALLQEKGRVHNLEVKSRTKSGVVKTALLSSEVRSLDGQDRVIVMLRDISDRKVAELALQQSEARYRAIVEDQTEFICRSLPDTTLVFVNEAFCRYYGTSEAALLGQPFLPFIYSEDQERVARLCQILTPDQPTITMENRVMVRGTLRWTQWINRMLFDLQGNPTELLSVGRDITELKQIEAALRTSEANLLNAQRIAHLGSWEFDITTQQITWSEELFRIAGFDPAQPEPSYETFLTIVPDEDHEKLDRAIQGSLAGIPYEIEHRFRRPDGTIRWVIAKGERSDDQSRLFGTILDITERKQVELALAQSEALNRAVLNAIPDLIIRMHRDGTYLDVKQAADFPSVMPNIAVGKNVRQVLSPEDAQRRLEVTATALQTGKVQVYEFSLWVQNQALWQEVRVIPLAQDQVLVLIRDLTQRKRTEEALRQSEARLTMAQQVAQLGNWEWDVETQKRTWSELTYRHWGLDPSYPEPSFAELLDRVHPEDRSDWQALAEAAISQGTSYRTDLRVLHPDGSTHYLETRAEPLFNSAGQVVKLIGTVLDITERKQTEAALQEREMLLRAIGDNLPKGFIYQRIYDPVKGFYYSYVSAGIERLLGLKPEDVLKDTTVSRTVGFAEDLALADQAARESLQNLTPIELQMRSRQPDGSIRWSSIRSIPRRLSDGRTVWDGLEVDITDLKQTEAALRASEEQFRRAFDDAPIGISLISPSGRFIKVNTYYCNLLGYSEAELLTRDFIDVTHPDDLEADLLGLQQMLTGEIPIFQMEKRYITKQGQIVPVLLNTAPIRDQDGQAIYIVGHVQDVRDRLKVERMKDEFISIVSHELRTPLTSIRGALGILDSGVFDNRPEKARHMLQIATTNSDRLVRLVNDILSLERLQSEKAPLVMESCQVADLMQQTVDGLQALADQSEVQLMLTTLEAQLWAAPDAIIQTLTNLISNAIKFSAAGDTVWLKAELQTADAEASPVLLLTVKDEGRGIPADKLELIFEQFQQVDVSDSRKKGGTGLGLAISKKIVQQHHGKIWVESTLGQGSTFYIALPLNRIDPP